MNSLLEIEVGTNVETVRSRGPHGASRGPCAGLPHFVVRLLVHYPSQGEGSGHATGGARFGMDDGYMIGPPELVLGLGLRRGDEEPDMVPRNNGHGD